jgi:hypothetical protein
MSYILPAENHDEISVSIDESGLSLSEHTGVYPFEVDS